MKQIIKIEFDEELKCPIFTDENGITYYPYYYVGGQGIELEWLTIEEINKRKKENVNK